jgi:hypothetical protein
MRRKKIMTLIKANLSLIALFIILALALVKRFVEDPRKWLETNVKPVWES